MNLSSLENVLLAKFGAAVDFVDMPDGTAKQILLMLGVESEDLNDALTLFRKLAKMFSSGDYKGVLQIIDSNEELKRFMLEKYPFIYEQLTSLSQSQ